MSRSLTAELFVPAGGLDPDAVGVIVGTLAGVGFAFEEAPGAGGAAWDEADASWRAPVTFSDALALYQAGREWAIRLHKRTLDGSIAELGLSVDVPDPGEVLGRFHLSTGFPRLEEGTTLAAELAAWTTFLAELTHPWYGWAGSDLGLFHRETTPIECASVEAVEPQPIEWLNVFGPPYVERLGLRTLLGLRHGQVRPMCDGSVAVLLAAHPDAVPEAAALEITRELGLPRVAIP